MHWFTRAVDILEPYLLCWQSFRKDRRIGFVCAFIWYQSHDNFLPDKIVLCSYFYNYGKIEKYWFIMSVCLDFKVQNHLVYQSHSKGNTGTSCLFNVYMSRLSVYIITSRITTLLPSSTIDFG